MSSYGSGWGEFRPPQDVCPKAKASRVFCCKVSIAFAVLDLSVDFPLEVKEDKVNLDLDIERSRLADAAPGGGAKVGGGSLRFRCENGEMTVMALAGLA